MPRHTRFGLSLPLLFVFSRAEVFSDSNPINRYASSSVVYSTRVDFTLNWLVSLADNPRWTFLDCAVLQNIVHQVLFPASADARGPKFFSRNATQFLPFDYAGRILHTFGAIFRHTGSGIRIRFQCGRACRVWRCTLKVCRFSTNFYFLCVCNFCEF